MNSDKFQQQVVGPMVEQVQQIFVTKGRDYAGDTDRLANFKRIAARLGISPQTVCLVYMMKHLDAIVTDAKTGSVKGEPVWDKLTDIVAYAMLYAGLDIESREKEKLPF